MSPEEELIRAGQARQVLESPIFMEAMARVEEALTAQRRAVPIRDTDMHTRLIITEQVWARITDWLKEAAETGKLAQFEIAEKRKRESIKERLFGSFQR
jgi:hypothetical protein